MRIQPWMTAVAGMVMLLVAPSQSSAQYPAPGAYQTGSPGAGPAGYYQPVIAPGGTADPNSLYPQYAPESFQPWPAISPFNPPNVSRDQTFNSNGLWFREILYRRPTTYASIEGMSVFFKGGGDSLIGSPYASPLIFHNPQSGGGTGGGGGGSGGASGSSGIINGVPQPGYAGAYTSNPPITPPPTGIYTVSPNVSPYVFLATTASTFVSATDASYYPIWNTSVLGNPGATGGIQGRLGFFNEDYSGIGINAWWASEADTSFSRGQNYINGVPVTQTLTDQLDAQNLTTRNGNISLYNGEGIPGASIFGAGSTAKYDVLYSLKFHTEAGGTNISMYQEPIYRSQGFMIRPMWGLRYLQINEGFSFLGIDSGFNYNYQATGGGGGGSTGGTTTGRTYRPTAGSAVRAYDQYTATLSNQIRSSIAGPEIGLRFDLGNTREGFRMWGESIFGLNANYSNSELSGDNIGDPLADVRFRGFTTPRILDDANYNSAFSQKKSTTHVSPLFQQSIFADFAFLDVIPVIRDMAIFDDAAFRIGYTVTVVGGVTRPADTITWQGFPLYPQLNGNTSSWWMQQISFAFDWHF
jgi:hypothetical protein